MEALNSTLAYNLCTIGYVVALFAYIGNLAWKRASLRRMATVVVGVSFILQTFGMVLRWMEAGYVEVAAFERSTGTHLSGLSHWVVFAQHPPWSNLFEIMVYMSWGIVLVFLICEVQFRIRFLGIFALLLALTTLGVASLTDGTVKPLVPALKSWWIMIHVISASIAYAAGTLAAAASLLYLIRAKERISLTAVAAGTMAVSAGLCLILGRGFSLFVDGTYRVKLLRAMGDDEIVVGKVIGEKFSPYFAPSPGVGFVLIAAIVLCVISTVLLWQARRRTDAPTKNAKILYFLSTFATFAVIALIAFNNITQTNVSVPAEVGMLMPPPPWRLSFRSNSWDLALFLIIFGAQVFVGAAALWPDKVRSLLPQSARLDRIAYANIMVSFALVAVVLVTGALWAHHAWGRYWAWDPKETGALVIWINYALYLHTRVTYGWAGPRSAIIGIIGFFVILAGFLGVNLGWFADGLHSYGSS